MRVEIEHGGDTPHFGGPASVRRGSETVRASDEVFQCLVDFRTISCPLLAVGVTRLRVSQVEEQGIATTRVHVRVDERIKEKAAKTLAGISVSDAVRMLLVRVAAEKALPFEVRVPNATTVKAMRAADRAKGKRHRSANAPLKELGI